MAQPATTVVIVPRETFSRARESLSAILATVPAGTPIVYVDGRSPRGTRKAIDIAAAEHGFTLVRSDRYLSPNEARNLGASYADSEFIVFADNDLIPEPGWVEHLEACARETGAWAVGPLYFIGEPASRHVHMAGGDAHIVEEQGQRRFVHSHRHESIPLASIDDALLRTPTEQLEFHCMLLRRDTLEALGGLDEELMSQFEHVDVCMSILERGGEVWIEPLAKVTYRPGTMSLSDVPYFLLRWSTSWNEASRRAFVRRWNLPADDNFVEREVEFCENHRKKHGYIGVRALASRLPRGRTKVEEVWREIGESFVSPYLARRHARLQRTARPPTLVRQAMSATPTAA